MIQDIRISQALFRLSSFKLKGILKSQIAKMIPLSEVSNQQLQKLIFAHFIMYSIKENQEIKKLMILIFKYQQNLHRDREIKRSEVDYHAKIITKNMIVRFIREIIAQNGLEEHISEEVYQEQLLEDFSPCFSQGWNIQQNNNQNEQLSSSKPFQPSISEKNSNQLGGGFSPPLSEVIIKQQFTNHDFSHCSSIGIISDVSQEAQLFSKTATHGHFLHGDQIQQIKGIFYKQEQMMAIVRWKERFSQYQPMDSIINIEVIREHSPLTLSIFYSCFVQQKEKQKLSTQTQA